MKRTDKIQLLQNLLTGKADLKEFRPKNLQRLIGYGEDGGCFIDGVKVTSEEWQRQWDFQNESEKLNGRNVGYSEGKPVKKGDRMVFVDKKGKIEDEDD